jgi:type II secretory pathway predicted ATPase ExeA
VLFDELGIEEKCSTKGEYLLALNRFLIGRLEQDLTTLLIVDEAQTLSREMLEEIRLLSNLETPTSKLIQILLIGQPELWEKLALPGLRQLRQRIVLRHQLVPFTEEETAAYVQERLRLAGYTGKGIFKNAALRKIHAVSGGTPRVINIVCDGALLLGFAREKQTLGADAIVEVARDLGLVDQASGSEPAASPSQAPLRRRRGLLRFFRARRVEGP